MADFIERIYYNLPIWLQNVLISAKGWDYRYRRENKKIILDQLEFLRRSEHWTQEQYREYQGKGLRQLLRIAFRQVPYYIDLREKLGCEPEDFKTPDDIKLLPILEKSQVRGQEHRFLNESIDLRKCGQGFTSGTTGTPINLYETQESFSRDQAFVVRLRSWAGLSNLLYPRRAQFTGRNIVPPGQDPNRHVYWRRNVPGNALLLSTTHISPETVPYYTEALRAFRPELIDGYPSAILIIARVSQHLGLVLPVPKAIIVSAETLLPQHRLEMEEAFQCKVYNQYAASEPTCLWCDCEFGVMHVNLEHGISEIVDAKGDPVQAGSPGEVLTTSFLNPVMILIRYRVGDVAIPGPSTPCECGRSMPRVASIEGRIDDILYIPERGYIGRLDPVFKGLSNIIEAQIIQEDLSHLRVLLVPDSGHNRDMELILLKNLRAKVGQAVKITVENVSEIPRGARGKFTSVISKVKHLYPHRMA